MWVGDCLDESKADKTHSMLFVIDNAKQNMCEEAAETLLLLYKLT